MVASSLNHGGNNEEASKKRKHSPAAGANVQNGDLNHIPKKRHHSDQSHNSVASSSGAEAAPMTITQRERRSLDQLRSYLEDIGGDCAQADGFRIKVVQQTSGDKFNTYFYTAEGRRLKSMIDVARFLGLVKDDRGIGSSQSGKVGKKKAGTGRPNNQRQLDAEQRKLRRELDRLMKAHARATKALDDHRNDHKNDRYPIEDDVLMEEEGEKLCQLPSSKPDIDGFPGIPEFCTPDLLSVWDFLCTFSRALSLETISLDNFATALTYAPKMISGDQSLPLPPVYLAEAHISLLKLLLTDPSSDLWWWSTLETEDAEAAELTPEKAKVISQHDPLKPVIKVNLSTLLSVEEDREITAQWLQALEDVRTKKPNSGVPIKSCVKSAISITKNPQVKSYLKKAMRKWRGNSAGLTKRAVIWLVDRVREARPDVWGREVSKEEIEEQKSKVARDAAMLMDQVDEEAEADIAEYDSGEESESESSSDEEEDSDDDGEEELDQEVDVDIAGMNVKQDDEFKPVTSTIPPKPPPATVDILLPPQKVPILTILSPFTWPSLTGATVQRVLHFYKRRRNEVDDALREFRELPKLTVAERRRREGRASIRMLTECTSPSGKFKDTAMEEAVSHLSQGGDYLELNSVQRLCILRVLVEAAYDTQRVSQCVENNIKDRINAVRALDVEERRAKREAREETSAAESAARERLAKEAREAWTQKKRREILRVNKITGEFSADYIEGLGDEEFSEFDDDSKAEYEALPTPQSFNKSEVNAMVMKLHEEEAFNTNSVLVLTLDEIETREKEILSEMEEELQNFGDIDTVYEHADRETTAKIDKLQREIDNMKDNVESLPQARAATTETLKDAMEEGTVKALRTAMRSANAALLTSVDEDTDGVWTLDLLRDAALELRLAERRKRVIEAQKDLVAKLTKCFVRTEPIGMDRFRNCFWHLDYDEEGRTWVETNYNLREPLDGQAETSSSNNCDTLLLDASSAWIGAKDEEGDMCPESLQGKRRNRFFHFSRQEYHSSGMIPALVRRHIGCHATDRSLRSLARNLDGRGARESALKDQLKKILQSHEARASNREVERVEEFEVDQRNSEKTYKTSGDDDHFRSVKRREQYKQGPLGGPIAFDLLQDFTSAISLRVRLRQVTDPEGSPEKVEYEMGTVIGWSIQEQLHQDNETETCESEDVEEPKVASGLVWKVILDKGGDLQLSGFALLESLSRFLKWRGQYQGYFEEDGPLFSYRNSLGRFCGRAVEAPYASAPVSFAQLLLRREQELYNPIKYRSSENNWGGKSGARNSWMASLKEYGHEFRVVRDGLLTLENAFFELTGGVFGNGEPIELDARSGKELLEDERYRLDIELESIGQVIGLWNSSETRKIFREVVSCEYVMVVPESLILLV